MRLLLAAAVFAMSAWGAANPLLPLSAAEIRQAVRIVNSSGRAPAGSRFSIIALKEPPKEAVLKGTATPRRAFLVVYDYQGNQTFEAIANLTSGALDSWKLIPGAEAPVTGEDSDRAFQIARRDPQFMRGLQERGIRDINNVYGVAWSATSRCRTRTKTASCARCFITEARVRTSMHIR